MCDQPQDNNRMWPGWRISEKAALWAWLSLLSVAVALTAALLAFVVVGGRGGVPARRTRHGATSATSNCNPSYIQFMKPSNKDPWAPVPPACEGCTLEARNDSLRFGRDGVYFLYAQVTLAPGSGGGSVTVTREPTAGKSVRKLAEANAAQANGANLWVGKMARMQEGDRVSVSVDGDFLTDDTFWGAFQIRSLAQT